MLRANVVIVFLTLSTAPLSACGEAEFFGFTDRVTGHGPDRHAEAPNPAPVEPSPQSPPQKIDAPTVDPDDPGQTDADPDQPCSPDQSEPPAQVPTQLPTQTDQVEPCPYRSED